MAQNNPPVDLAAQMVQLGTQLTTLQGEVTSLCQENVMLTNANATLTTQVAEIVTAPTPAPTVGAAGAVWGAPGAPVRFATTPAMLRHEDILDYSSKMATMIYEDGCESLTTSFDMKSNGTVIYITELQAKCNRMGWHTGTQQIICLSTGPRYTERASQNNQMMTECIMKTLSGSARARLLPFRNEVEHNVVYTPLLHKKVMALATINSVATTKTLRSNLKEFTTHCTTVKGNSKLMHSYFDTNYSQIIARSANTNGTATFTHEELILLATNKYNLIVQSGEWGAKSLEEEKIIAMQAELMALKGQFVLAPNLKRTAGKKKDGDKKDNDNKGDKKGGKKKNKKNTANKCKQRKMRSGNAYLPRTANLTRRSTTIAPTIGASTICVGAITRKRNVSKVRNA